MKADFRDRLRSDSNWKFVFAAILVLGLIFMLIFSPRGKEFHLVSEEEVGVAFQICENSREWVENNRSRLKIDQARLNHIKVNGEVPKFKHVKTPKVIFIASGFDAPNMMNDIFCEVIHPATGQKYYFDYANRVWKDKVRFRR